MKRGLLFLLLVSLSVPAAEPDLDRLRGNLAKTFPEAAQGELRPSPLPGFFELVLDAKVYYVSADGKHLLLGDLVDIKSRTNLTENARQALARRLIDEIGEKDMIVMAPRETRATITVFTDVDCPYCARLHQDVPELNRNGVKVRYLLYPRAGKGSETYRRSVAVWCAPDRIEAVGIAKSGGQLDLKTCDNPVDNHYRLGERLDINGTPTIYLENGRKIPGYVPAAQLVAVVRGRNSAAQAP
jgi:thiol:disulfide interchange protein DsbC